MRNDAAKTIVHFMRQDPVRVHVKRNTHQTQREPIS